MERLYAPWRMEYIGGPPEPGCLFCRVRQAGPDHDRSNLLVFRGERFTVMLNKFPYNSGHLMVAPVAHVGSPVDLDQRDGLALHEGMAMALRALTDALAPEGFNIGANIGRVAGAGIPDHVHHHVVPRWTGDTNFMPVVGETKVVNEHLERTWEKLVEAFSPSGG